jgi:F-type H+-transporting ATPase subunit epsilon
MLQLTIVTPERPFIDEACLFVTVPGRLGEMQILPGHAALLAELAPGIMLYQKQNKEISSFMIGEGFVEVNSDRVNILCEQARYKNEIDEDFEKNLLIELKDQIKKYNEASAEQKRVFAELERCAARLSLFE